MPMFNPQGYKAECNGNDFIIIMKDHYPDTFNDGKIKELCDRDSGIGADGLLLIDLDVDSYDYQDLIASDINSDGILNVLDVIILIDIILND